MANSQRNRTALLAPFSSMGPLPSQLCALRADFADANAIGVVPA